MSTKNYFLKKHRKQPTTSGHIKEPYFELAARTWLGTEQRGEGHRISGTGEACRQPTAASRPLFRSEDTPGPARRGSGAAGQPLGTVRLTSPDFQPAGERPAAVGAHLPGAGSAEPWEGARGRSAHPAGSAAPLRAHPAPGFPSLPCSREFCHQYHRVLHQRLGGNVVISHRFPDSYNCGLLLKAEEVFS